MNMRMKVAVTFKGSNYLVWSRMVKTAVGSKGLWGHITTGEAPKLITQGGDQEEVSNEAAVEKMATRRHAGDDGSTRILGPSYLGCLQLL